MQECLGDIFEYLHVLFAPVILPVQGIRAGSIRRPGRQNVAGGEFFRLLLAQHRECHIGFEVLRIDFIDGGA